MKMNSEEYKTRLQHKVVSICEAIIKKEVGIVVGSRELVSLCFEIFDNHDPDFMIFSAIDSETDHLPVGFERNNWCGDALKIKDIETFEYEQASEVEVRIACQNLISRFSKKN